MMLQISVRVRISLSPCVAGIVNGNESCLVVQDIVKMGWGVRHKAFFRLSSAKLQLRSPRGSECTFRLLTHCECHQDFHDLNSSGRKIVTLGRLLPISTDGNLGNPSYSILPSSFPHNLPSSPHDNPGAGWFRQCQRFLQVEEDSGTTK
jgi:hypothetical protein